MTLTEAINNYTQSIEAFNQQNQLIVNLRDIRLPELKARLSSKRHSLRAAEIQLRDAVSDDDYDTAKQQCKRAQIELDDCIQMIENTEAKIKSWQPNGRISLQSKIDDAKRVMWKMKEDEIIASLPKPLPDNVRIGIQKLIAISTMNDAFKDDFYGRNIDKIYGKVDTSELEQTKQALLTEMEL